MAKESQDLKEVLARLEQIVEELNTKDVDVEQGLKKFQEGAALVKVAREKLKKAENEFTKLRAELDVEEEKE